MLLPKIKLFAAAYGGMFDTVVQTAVQANVLRRDQVYPYSRRIGQGTWVTPYNNVLAADLGLAIQNCNVVGISAPPKDREAVYAILSRLIGEQFIFDMSAGPNAKRLQYYFPNNEIACAMPNKGSGVGFGHTSILPVTTLSEGNIQILTQIFGAGGHVKFVKTLKEYDEDTAFYGSGPGFELRLMQARIRADIARGTSPKEARVNAEQVWSAVLAMLKANPDANIDEIMNTVASSKPLQPGEEKTTGTTAEEFLYLDEAGIDGVVQGGFGAGARRAGELREQFGGKASGKKFEGQGPDSFFGEKTPIKVSEQHSDVLPAVSYGSGYSG